MNSSDYVALHSSLADDELKLLQLTLKFNNLKRLRDSCPERLLEINALNDEIAVIQEIIQSTRNSLNLVGISSVSTTLFNTHKLVKQLRESGFPRFSPNTQDVLEYLDSFELACQALSVPVIELPNLFKLLIPFDDGVTLQWVSRNMVSLSWSELKKVLIEHYQDSSSERLRETKFLSIERFENETLKCFCDRFIKLMYLANMNQNVELCKSLFLATLNSTLSLSCTDLSHTCSTVEELCELAKKIQNNRDSKTYLNSFFQKNNEKQPEFHNRHSSTSSHLSDKSQSSSFERPKKSFCFYCKQRDHTIENCFKLRNKSQATLSSPSITSKGPLSSSAPTNSKAVLTAVCAMETPVDYPHPGKLTSIPISINDCEITAHLDSCSQISILSKNLAAKLSIPTVPCALEVNQFSNGKVSNNRLTKGPIPVRLGSVEVKQHFLVCELQQPLECILGTDAFQKFNLFIGGIQLNQTSSDDIQVVEQASPMQCNVSIDTESSQKIYNEIQESLEYNINNTVGFCNLPNSLVKLPTIDEVPIHVSQYPIAHALCPVVDLQVEKWLNNGIICPATQGTCWNSSLIIIKKLLPDGAIKHRVCIDPRHLNKKMLDDKFPIPRLRELLDKAANAQIFSALDLENSYHQFEITASDRTKTSFTWKGVQYMFIGCPFGLKTITSVFQRVMSELFSDMPFVAIYVDDILVFSKSLDEHIQHLNQVLNRLTEANLTVNKNKCLFGYLQLHVLGHIISSKGIQIDKSKLEDIQNCPIPTSSKDVQSFLGIVNYFRDFIPNFAMIASPLDNLRNVSKNEFIWTNEHTQSFLSLKECLKNPPILTSPNFSKPFFIATDASAFGISAVLFQTDCEDYTKITLTTPRNKKFIKFASRSLKKSERNYPTCKRELLAIVFALLKFQNFILGEKIVVLSDNKPLSYLLSQKNLNSLHYCWLDCILRFNIEICYYEGKVNTLPDLLSRLCPDYIVASATVSAISSSNDEPVAAIENVHFPSKAEEIAVRMGLELVLPENQTELLNKHHQISHCSARELYSRIIRDGKYWLNARTDCETFVSACNECQKYTIVRSGYHPQKSILANQPMDHVLVDLLGPLPESNGFTFILVCIDVFSRFIFLKPLINKTAISVAENLYSIFTLFGHPKILQTDNGTEFVNGILEHLGNLFNWSHRTIVPYHPQANGMVERAVRTTLDFIRKNINNSSEWAFDLQKIQLKINQRISSSHSSVPFNVMFARNLNEFKIYEKTDEAFTSNEIVSKRIDEITSIIYPSIADKESSLASSKNSSWNNNHKLVNFSPGDCVMVRNCRPNDKFDARYLGPFNVASRTRGGSYKLSIATGELLRRNFPPNHLKLVHLSKPVTSFLVEDIVDSKIINDVPLFRVRWFGFSESDDTWEPASSFDDPEIIRRYLSIHGNISNQAGNDVNAIN